jgi:hypothetical protein
MLETEIINQVNFYFSTKNLAKDKFLNDHLEDGLYFLLLFKNKIGWLPFSVLQKFKKVEDFQLSDEKLYNILQKSEVVMVEKSPYRVKRIPTLADQKIEINPELLIDEKGVGEDEKMSNFENNFLQKVVKGEKVEFDIKEPLPAGYVKVNDNSNEGCIKRLLREKESKIEKIPDFTEVITSELFVKPFATSFYNKNFPTQRSEVFVVVDIFFTSTREFIYSSFKGKNSRSKTQKKIDDPISKNDQNQKREVTQLYEDNEIRKLGNKI